LIKHNFFLNKNSVVDLDPEFLFGSGTRENPSGYTTHEITIFKYKMGDFCFWPKETMYQQLRFHFDFILSRFYLFKYCWTVLHHGGCLPMVW